MRPKLLQQVGFSSALFWISCKNISSADLPIQPKLDLTNGDKMTGDDDNIIVIKQILKRTLGTHLLTCIVSIMINRWPEQSCLERCRFPNGRERI